MRLFILLLALGLVVAGTSPTEAIAKVSGKSSARSKDGAKIAQSKKVSSKMKTTKSKSELQTDVKFDDSVLHGQYQTPDEALARVENEKGLSDLLGVRKHFKDRLATASEQE